MSRIICGMFDRSVDADAALDAFKHEGFQRGEIDSFYVSPPGQHAMTPLGGAAGWLFSDSLIVIPLIAGLGAYVGSFAGAMGRVRAGRRGAASVEHPVE